MPITIRFFGAVDDAVVVADAVVVVDPSGAGAFEREQPMANTNTQAAAMTRCDDIVTV